MKKVFIIFCVLSFFSTLTVCPEEKEDSDQKLLFSINGLVGYSHFLGSYSEIARLYYRRIPKGFYPEGHNLPVDDNFEEDIVIKKGMNVGLIDGEKYSAIGQIDGFRFIVDEILSEFFFQVDGSLYKRMPQLPQRGLFVISDKRIPPVTVHSKTEYAGDHKEIIYTLSNHLKGNADDLLSMFPRKADFNKMDENEINGLIGGLRLNNVYEFKDSFESVKVAEGNAGDFGRFLILFFDDGSYKFMANTQFRAFFSISDNHYMWLLSGSPGTGIMIYSVHLLNNNLIQIFKEGGFST